jgi:hypothetical protein
VTFKVICCNRKERAFLEYEYHTSLSFCMWLTPGVPRRWHLLRIHHHHRHLPFHFSPASLYSYPSFPCSPPEPSDSPLGD